MENEVDERMRDSAARIKLADQAKQRMIEDWAPSFTAAMQSLCEQIGTQGTITERMIETFGRQNQATERMLLALERQNATAERMIKTLDRLEATSRASTAATRELVAQLALLHALRAQSGNGHDKDDNLSDH